MLRTRIEVNMQHKILKCSVILASLIVLTLTFIYYADSRSVPEATPRPAQPINRQVQKPAQPLEKAVPQPKSPPANSMIVVEAKQEMPKKPVSEQSPAEPTRLVETKPSAEPKAVSPPIIEVSRSDPHTYADPGYPLLSKQSGSYGQFHYRDTSGGRIEIDPAWVEENIVTIVLPGLNQSVEVHKDAADNFIAAFNYIKNGTAVINGREMPLLSLIKTMDGTFVTRHVNWNPSRGLSNHSWGIAIDINAADHFCYINPASQADDPNLVLWEKAFKPAGFSWGNSYSDSMHFELLD